MAYTGGLWDVFTAVSAGQLNINTASAGALQLLPGIDEHMAENIMKQRAGPDGMEGTEDDTPFMNVQQLLAVPGLNPALAQQLQRYITVRSTTFEVQVDVEFGSSKRRYYGLLRRNSGTDIQLLHLHWD